MLSARNDAVSPITTHGRQHVNHGKSSEIRGETIQRDDKRGRRSHSDTTVPACARACVPNEGKSGLLPTFGESREI